MPLVLHSFSSKSPTNIALLACMSRIHLQAWLTNKCYAQIYPGPPSSHAGIIKHMLARHTNTLTTDPTARFAMILDTDLPAEVEGIQGKVIAAIKYNIFESAEAESERKDTGERTWPEHTNIPLVEEFWSKLVELRSAHGHDLGPHVLVDLLMTDPDHHRRGAGGMLMRHAVADADRLRLPGMLEASPDGLKLYRSVGFREVGEFWVDLKRYADGGDKGEEWAKEQGRFGDDVPKDDGWYRQIIMLRPALNDN